MTTIAERVESALNSISQYMKAKENLSSTQQVNLLAVSKTKPAEDIIAAYEAGLRKFGENYVQEGVEKIEALEGLDDIEWHFIGPLQSNKSALVAEHFDWMQSIDRLKIAQRLNDQRSVRKAPLQVCIQVNISDETQKSGVPPEQVLPLAEQVARMPKLRLRGLMTIPKANASNTELTDQFNRVHALYNELQSQYDFIDTLSMGMSGDWQTAIDCGSTMIRMGTALFGPRHNSAPPT